jgi:hypothetical protein
MIGWINIYNLKIPGYMGVYKTKKEADDSACSGRIACIKIEYDAK